MSKKAFEKKGSCCDQHQLDKEIRELMISLERQNSLLSGYYERITMRPLAQGKKKAIRKNGPAVNQDKAC